MDATGNSISSRSIGFYVPIGSALVTLIALLSFWVSFSERLDSKFEKIQTEIRVIRETIVANHGVMHP